MIELTVPEMKKKTLELLAEKNIYLYFLDTKW